VYVNSEGGEKNFIVYCDNTSSFWLWGDFLRFGDKNGVLF